MSPRSFLIAASAILILAVASPARADLRRPLAFEPDTSAARFVARADGYSVLLSPREAVMKRGTDVVRLRFDGTRGAGLLPLERQPGIANYILGNDPAQWRTGVPTYARVQYRRLYPGIDVVFYGNERQLEYDFVVQPGADPRRIRMTLDGASFALRDGDLVGRGTSGEFRVRKPVIYQDDAGVRREVAGRFRLSGRQVSFDIGPYDRSKPLVIDPVIVYSTLLGGSLREVSAHNGIAVDAAGNAYVTGYTDSFDFPTTAGSYWTSKSAEQTTAFVTKIAADGTTVLYSTYLGGTVDRFGVKQDFGTAIAVDAAGSAYAVGHIFTSNFPSTAGTVFQGTAGMFLTKLNGAGQIVYSATWGGTGDEPTGVALDAQNNVYVTGKTTGLDPWISAGAFQTVCRCFISAFTRWDGFVAKLNPSASAVLYGTYLGGWASDEPTAIAVDAAGQATVTGRTGSDDFPLVNAAQSTWTGLRTEAFVTRLTADGSAAVFSTYLGGQRDENAGGYASGLGGSIAVDAAGAIYLTGSTDSPDFPTTAGAPYPNPPTGFANPFVVKMTPAGQIVYSTYLPGGWGAGIAVDAFGRAYVAGSTGNVYFPTTADATQPSLASVYDDAFLTVLDPTGTSLLFSTYLGGVGQDIATGIALGSNGSVYMAGQTEGATAVFATTPGAFQTTGTGGSDLWVARISFGPPPDTTAPVITSVTASPSSLWPPNNKMVAVEVTVDASDDRDANPACRIVAISGDQGATSADWGITGPLTATLRASKGPRAAARTYTITVECADAAGNTAQSSVQVVVPRSQ